MHYKLFVVVVVASWPNMPLQALADLQANPLETWHGLHTQCRYDILKLLQGNASILPVMESVIGEKVLFTKVSSLKKKSEIAILASRDTMVVSVVQS